MTFVSQCFTSLLAHAKANGLRHLVGGLLVWVYERGHEEYRCEVRPTVDGFDVAVLREGVAEITHFADAEAALRWQLTIERRLLASGWKLKEFHSSDVGGSK
jgi:hypothetical protein